MRIHRLTVRHFRGIADRTIELPETGTTVIVGDNEVGKSSLVEALLLLFDLADDSKAARVRNVQPFGSDVAPEVGAELTLGDQRLTYAKRWLRTRSTELTVTGPDGAKRSFTGREAHNEADRLFRKYVDPVLWQTLLVGQGQSLVQPAPADAEPLIAAVTAESGTPIDGASMPLVAAVEQEYLRYWTKGGRPTNDFARLTEELAAAEAQAEQARQAMDAVASDIRRAERLSQDLADIKVRVDEQTAEVERLERCSRDGEALLARRDATMQKADTARARLENRTAARAERDRLVAEVERRTAAVAELRARIAEIEPAGNADEAARDAAQAALAAAVDRRDERRTALHDAEQHLARLSDQAELVRLTERRSEVEAVRERVAAARAVLESCRVTDELLAALEDARSAVVMAAAALQAGAPQVVVRRLGGDAPVQVSDDATLFGSELTGTEEVKQRVSGELRVVVPGQLEVTVRAGGEVAGLRKAVEVAKRREQQLLGEAGAKDLTAARELVRRRDVAAAELAESRRSEAALVAAGDPAERIAVLTARVPGTG
ncbi:MAG TPA: AAA family ATPase, partial [Kribbellaceae bacterium]|nr:AAA family ATPase [Kribbellaceae bacterium]